MKEMLWYFVVVLLVFVSGLGIVAGVIAVIVLLIWAILDWYRKGGGNA